MFQKRIVHILSAYDDPDIVLKEIPNYTSVKRRDMTDSLAARKFNDIFRVYFKLSKFGLELASLKQVVLYL